MGQYQHRRAPNLRGSGPGVYKDNGKLEEDHLISSCSRILRCDLGIPTEHIKVFLRQLSDFSHQEMVRLWIPTEPVCHTDIEILEEGDVPILLSLPQMRNLYFNLELSPEAVYLTCEAFGYYRKALCTSHTKHLVLDFSSIKYAPAKRNGEVQTAFVVTNSIFSEGCSGEAPGECSGKQGVWTINKDRGKIQQSGGFPRKG